MTRIRYLLILLVIFASACSTTKYLQPGQKLYDGGKVKIVDKNAKKSDRKALTGELEGLLRPKPNSKILGMRFKLWVYDKTRTQKRRGLRHY
ncbi:MAG TPA: hypothetical protein VJ844_14440, partial [Mucilaginibacter sp.]|nr:hypothetical protein [Mucilaginibacter sp.]